VAASPEPFDRVELLPLVVVPDAISQNSQRVVDGAQPRPRGCHEAVKARGRLGMLAMPFVAFPAKGESQGIRCAEQRA
jgi:hypothetical protein